MSVAGLIKQALRALRHPGGSSGWGALAAGAGRRPSYDYARDVGQGLTSSVVMAPIQWLQRALPTAPIAVERRDDSGKLVADHPLVQLLRRPNPAYDGEHLLQATIVGLCLAGNAYWIKRRNGAGRVAELWYVPHWTMRPRWPTDGSEWITHYDYQPGGAPTPLEPRDVVHFRCGVDINDLRMGLAPLASVLREVWTDMEVAVFQAAILRQTGITGLIVSPRGDEAAIDDVAQVKAYLAEHFSSERRGSPLVFGAPTQVERVGWSPRELDLSAASNRAEERVCALLGVPPVVVGLHAGTTQTSVGATMREQVKLAWHGGVLPLQSLIAAEIGRSLLPEFGGDAQRLRVYFDTSEVEALREDVDAVAVRAERMVRAGLVTLAEARQMVGMESDARHDIFLRPFGVVEIPGSTNRAPAAPVLPELPELAAARSATKALKHTHSSADLRIAQTAPHRDPSEAQEAYLGALDASRRRRGAQMRRALAELFADLGRRAEAAAEQVLADDDDGKAAAGAERKDASMLATMSTERVAEAMRLSEVAALLAAVYERVYIDVAGDLVRAARAARYPQLAVGVPDPVMRAVLATGGRRAGLVDLDQQTRDRLYSTILQGRAEGRGALDLARQIREIVPAGPWSSPEVRAEVIARTETKYAQNYSVVEHAKANGVEQFMIFDARLGETDEVCMALDGAIVTAQEAQELMASEHPNGTRAFVPHFD